MQCELCGGDSTVRDSRDSPPFRIRRRRQCLNCGKRWTTMEERVNPGDPAQRCARLEDIVRQVRATVEAA